MIPHQQRIWTSSFCSELMKFVAIRLQLASCREEKENFLKGNKRVITLKLTLACYVMSLSFEEGQECLVSDCVMKTFENVVALKLIIEETVCMTSFFLKKKKG